ncbi:DUF4381 domain-containing protein [Vibrio sp. RC27]
MKQTLSNLLQLNPLHLPPSPSWWPIAWGWLSLIGSAIVALLLLIFLFRMRQKKLAPKKAALRIFSKSKETMTASEAMEIVRQAALSYFPRDEMAKLTGHDWYAFLDSYVSTPLFTQNETLWQKALYQKAPNGDVNQLVDDCQDWVRRALPPAKRSSTNVG